MANVGFKLGLQTALDALLTAGTAANATPGTFYLTSDTNRLYIGKEDKSIAPVNAGIITVDKIRQESGDAAGLTYLPVLENAEDKKKAIGNYYYAKKENILCVFNGDQWVQINSVVTNTSIATDVSGTGTVTVDTVVSQTAGGSVSDSYKITGANGLTVSAANDTVTVSTTTPITMGAEQGANNKTAAVSLISSLNKDGQAQKFNLVGGTNVDSINVSGDDITINVQDTKNTGLSTDVSADAANNKVTIATAVSQAPGNAVSDEYSITGSNGIKVTSSAADALSIAAEQIKVGVATATGGAAVSLNDSGLVNSTNKGFNIVSGNSNVTVAVDGNNIKISSIDKDTTTQSVSTDLGTSNGVVTVTTTVTPTEGLAKQDSYTITGSNGINVSSTGDALTVSADKMQMGVAAASNGANVKLQNSAMVDTATADFNIIPGNDNVTVEVDGKNVKISSVDTDTTVTSVALTAANTGIDFALTPSAGNTLTANVDPIVAYGKNGTVEAHFNSGKATLNVYTADETDALIDSELKLFNSMVYRGVLASESEPLPTANVAVGDTYLIGYDGYETPAPDKKSYPKGTLVIARSTYPTGGGEVDGYIPSGYIQWDYVTGSQVDTQYQLMAIANGVELFTDGTKSSGSLTIKDAAADTTTGNDVIVTTGNTSGNTQALTVKHKKYEVNAGAADGNSSATMSGGSFDIIAVDTISTSNGHITGYTTKKFTVKDTNATLSAYQATVAKVTENKSVKLTQSVAMTPNNGGNAYTKETNISFESTNDNLQINANTGGSGIVMNLVWGTF